MKNNPLTNQLQSLTIPASFEFCLFKWSGYIYKALRVILTLLFIILVASCATYKPLPLNISPPLISLKYLIKEANASPLIKHGTITLADGLNLNEIASLALFNSPELQIYKQQYLQAQANAYAQGLLPDPQLSISIDNPRHKTLRTMNAWTASFGFDLSSLLTYQLKKNIGRQLTQQALLNLQWQAWQIAQNAQLLLIDNYFAKQKINLITSMVHTLKQRYQHSRKGLAEDNITLATNGNDLATLLNSYSQLNTAQQDLNEKSSQLEHLLGINHSIDITTVLDKTKFNISEKVISTELAKLAQTRPDLLALQYGYQAQEQSVRSAILAQFPAINIGISAAKDSGGLRTQGLNIGITLPLFNANKGNIAIERATRATLAAEYKARLLNTKITVEKLWHLHKIIDEQQQRLNTYLPTLTTLVNQAKSAYQSGDISSLSYLSMESSWFHKKIEQLDLAHTQWITQTTLHLLLMMTQTQYINSKNVDSQTTKNTIK